MKKFTIPCFFDGQNESDRQNLPFEISVGEPCAKRHPLHYQARWLSTEQKGTIPPEVMDGFQKLHQVAKENDTSFEELCVYVLGTAPEGSSPES